MLAIFLELDPKGLHHSGKEKKVVVSCSRPRQNVTLGSFTLRSFNDGREMYKKRGCTRKVVVFGLSKPKLSWFLAISHTNYGYKHQK